jgi:hypothetical protein
MARPNPLANPDFAKSVAECFVDGLSRKEMAELFGVKDLDTITRWRRDPRVKAIALRLLEDRVLQVTRKVDAVIAQRLETANEMTTKELLEIRKEFLGGALRQQTEKADDETINETMTWLDENPEAAAQLAAIMSGDAANPVSDMVEAAE